MDALTEAPAGRASPSPPAERVAGAEPRSRSRRLALAIRLHLLPLVGYIALAAAVYWPVVRHPRSEMLADGGDGAFYVWDLWWFPRAVLHGHNPFRTAGIFYPFGAPLGFNTILAPFNLASWPLQKAFGLAMAVNAVQLEAVVLTGFGLYLLARQVGAAPLPAFVAGGIFAFTPYRMSHLAAHVNLNHTEVLVFGLWALLRLYDRPTRGRAVVLGVILAVTLWSDGYYSVFLGFAAVVVVAWRWKETLRPEVLRRLGQAVLVAGLLAVPLLGAMATELHHHELDPVPGWGGADVYSADLASWIAPLQHRRFLSDMLTSLDPAVLRGERVIFPTWTLLVAGAAGAALGGRRRRGLWVLVFGVFFVLSLGPFLEVNGWTGGTFHRFGTPFSVPLPGLALTSMPLLNGVRDPARFAVMAVLALAVLAALALTRLQERHRRAGMLVAVVVGALALAESLPASVTMLPSAVPAAYRAIAADPGGGAVLEIPTQWRTGFGAYGETNGDHTLLLYYGTSHGKPMVNGLMPRYPQRTLDRLLRLPVYDQLLGFFTSPAKGERQSVPAGRAPGEAHPPATFTAADLRASGIGYVVYHQDRPRPAAAAYIERLGLPVLADDGTVTVWKVPPA